MSLTFHETFSLERQNISKLLDAIAQNPFVSDVEIADATGIGIGKTGKGGKVRPTIKYAAFCGLLNTQSDSKGMFLTQAGLVVRENDEWLNSPTTQWLMHYFLSSKEVGATAWIHFVHEFLPFRDEFERETVRDFLDSINPTLNEKTRVANVGLLFKSYIDNSGLYRTKIFREVVKDRFFKETSTYPNVYLAAYILAEIWDAKHPEKTGVEPSVLLEPGHFATTMNMNKTDVQDCLNEMNAVGLIEQMREAPPFQVVRRWTNKFELLQRAYEN